MAVKVTIELTGPARISAGRKEVRLIMPSGAVWRDVIGALAQEVPMLVGKAITRDRRGLLPSYLLNLGGRYTIQDLDERAELREGDLISLLTETC